jgi:RNA polymerase sigma-70 factor (ECF subfamily)
MIDREAQVAGHEGVGPRSGSERRAVFGRLIVRRLAASYRLAALLLGSEVEAQDAIQDAALIAWQRFASLRDPDRFDAWFQRIVVNICRDRLRRRGSVRFLAMDGVAEPQTQDGAQRRAESDALRRSVNRLPPDQRMVIVLRYFAELSLEEIAEQTDERLGTVKSRLHYAVEALHAAYDAATRLPGGTAQ